VVCDLVLSYGLQFSLGAILTIYSVLKQCLNTIIKFKVSAIQHFTHTYSFGIGNTTWKPFHKECFYMTVRALIPVMMLCFPPVGVPIQ
jgi:hypothetical protein